MYSDLLSSAIRMNQITAAPKTKERDFSSLDGLNPLLYSYRSFTVTRARKSHLPLRPHPGLSARGLGCS